MPISRWIVTVADAALFAVAVLALIAAPVLCVLLVRPTTPLRGERDACVECRPSWNIGGRASHTSLISDSGLESRCR